MDANDSKFGIRQEQVLGFSLRPKPLLFCDFAQRFLKEATSELAPASIARHRQNLWGLRGNREGHLLAFFGKRNLKSIGVKDIARYIRHRQDTRVAPNTIHKELATLSSIFRFALQEEIVLFNPVLAVKKPKLKLVRPNYRPTPSQIILILNAIHPKVRRFFLAYCSSGCRKSELIACNVGDVDLEQRLLRVIGKGNKERFVPTNDILYQQIQAELESRPRAKPDFPLFVNREGRRYKTIRNSLERACAKAQVPHIGHTPFGMPLRRRCITRRRTWFLYLRSLAMPIRRSRGISTFTEWMKKPARRLIASNWK